MFVGPDPGGIGMLHLTRMLFFTGRPGKESDQHSDLSAHRFARFHPLDLAIFRALPHEPGS